MRASKTRFVAGCQQLLVLGTVCAVLVPAASVVSLDVVGTAPDHDRSEATTVAAETAAVPDGPVDADLREIALTGTRAVQRPTGRSLPPVTAPRVVAGHATESPGREVGVSVVTSAPQQVSGYGAVGLTWAAGQELVSVGEETFEVRTLTDGAWSEWHHLDYDPDHAETADAAESRQARPGTDLLFVGEVDQAQVRVELPTAELPSDLRLAVVDPGEAGGTSTQPPAVATTPDGAEEVPPTGKESEALAEDGLELQAAGRAAQPRIFTRAQWGANESLRDGSPRYGVIRAGIVHHTVNANDYTQAQVPGIIRSIYAYHTRSRGWSDIGYNFLVDRWGRIWEGRAGGITRPVIGAHASEYNDVAFGVSVIGNYEIARPGTAVLAAFGRIMAWKLGLHGIDPQQRVTLHGRSFPAIIGHRDTKSTACPGRYLYAQLPAIRRRAKAAQGGGTPTTPPTQPTVPGLGSGARNSNLAGSAYPDLIARARGTGQGYVIPTGGTVRFAKSRSAGRTVGRTLATPDLTGDGRGDLYVIGGAGRGQVRAGNGAGGFGGYSGRTPRRIFAGRDLLVAVGDISGDGRNDLIGRHPRSGRLTAYVNTGTGRLRGVWLRGGGWNRYDLLVGAGDLTGDRRADLLARDKSGRLWLRPGTGRLRPAFGAPRRVAGNWRGYDAIVGMGDYTGDGHGDLLARSSRTGQSRLFFGRGNGTFGVSLGPLPALRRAGRILGAAQLSGDGKPDVLSSSGASLRITATAPTFSLGRPLATGVNLRGYTRVFNAGDWDRDGKGDLIGITRTGAVNLFTGRGTGRFSAPRRIGAGFARATLVTPAGDMTGDGWPDLLAQGADRKLRVYAGRGPGALRVARVLGSNLPGQVNLAVGRWNADSAPDILLRVGNRLRAYYGTASGRLSAPRSIGPDLAGFDQTVAVSSVGLKGHSDVIARRTDGSLYVLLGNRRGGLGKPRPLGQGMGGFDLLG
ncbi:FG-GAP-like repeat-containing protein [Nocardioides insulae]|uniref:FG-GAP-like repeat-containing protein n=1 Tax=Nocardioides insulae TaxID=394734 RepID=UPI0004180CAD|nr:FG-GAP-like repeat-containing protein [Nocardioides insulae]